MCARRFLILIFLLTLVVVAAGFAIYQFGGRMLVKQATPTGHFAAPQASDSPDYRNLGNWLERPELGDHPSAWRPDGDSAPTALPQAKVVTFYIHPTTYLARDRWNAPIAGDQAPVVESRGRAELFVRSQASVFAGLGPVWAPRYRQAAFGAFLLKSEDADKALNLAYRDVRSAFDAFLEANPAGPIILAGHSQGSLHLLRLLAERKDRLKGRLVAAYVAGWPVGIRSDLPATGLPPCARPDQTDCVLSWQSFAEPANMSMVTTAWVGTLGLSGLKRERDDMLCVDPISGEKDGQSQPRDNPGTLVPTIDLAGASVAAGQVGSRCKDGFLLLGGPIPTMGPYVLPGNSYHVYDYALFWGAIRADAARRAAAWRP